MYCKATATTVLIALSIAAAAASGPATQLGPAAADAAAAGNSPEEVANDYRAYRTHLARQSQDATTSQLADLDRASALIDGITDWGQLRGGRAKQFVKAHGRVLHSASTYKIADAWATCELKTTAGSRVETVTCKRRTQDEPGTSEQMRRLNQGSQQTG